MPSEKYLARKISLISTSVFTLFLICLVIFTRFFLIQREQTLLRDIDTTPIKDIIFGENYIGGTSMMQMGAVTGTDTLPAIDIATGTSISSIEGLPDIGTLTPQEVTVNSDAGMIFEALRDSVVMQNNGTLIKNGLFHFMDIRREEFIGRPEYFSQRIGEKTFLFRTITEENVIVFVSKDVNNIESLIINLIKFSIGAIIIFIIVIYFLSRFFAQLTMSPIRKNNTLLREFNHSLAHEIKTPLSVIRLNLEMLESKTKSSLISSAVEEVDTISSITDAMLFISEGTIIRENEEVKLTLHIRNFIDRHYANKISIVGKSEKVIRTNQLLFDRILTNICDNALKYGENKPVIYINETGFSIENEIKETLTQDILKKLGTPFFQVHSTNKDKGSGLGLSIVKKIADILGWQVFFISEKKAFIVKILIIDQL